MYLTKTKLARATSSAALLLSLVLSAQVSAAAGTEAMLTQNERAAQSAISDAPVYDRAAPSDVSTDATLAHNERAAQRTIVASDDSLPNSVSAAMGEATLVHNEFASQRAISDAPAYGRTADAGHVTATLSPSSSTQPAAAR